MQLFILGPAFGLPSIDAECNAAVALLQLTAPQRYTLVPTHKTKLHLPHLLDGQTQISGFNNIVRYLFNKHVLDQGYQLSDQQRNDALAIISFIESDAQTLLDISLYVGFENYRLATRPAFTKILPWHANYIVPPQRRAAARARTDHLGISGIDVDNVHEDMSNRPQGMDGVGKEPGFEAETQKRASLLLPQKETLRSLLQRPEHAAVFKLHALADNFFGTLGDLLGDRSYFLGSEQPTFADCLVYGYLGLMLYPQLPQDWLASTMRRKYRSLTSFTERMHVSLGMATSTEVVVGLAQRAPSDALTEVVRKDESPLPWSPSNAPPVLETLQEITEGIWEQLPLIGYSGRLQLRSAEKFSYFDRNLHLLLLSTALSLGATGYLLVRTGFFVWPHGEEVQIFGRKRLSDYGHLGAALAGLNIVMPQTRHLA